MAIAAQRPCPNGHGLISGRRCPACEAKRQAEVDAQRPAYHSLYESSAWRRMRAHYLKLHPRCVACGQPADTADHVIPHRGSTEKFWDMSNLQSLCRSCHSRKTALEVNERTHGHR